MKTFRCIIRREEKKKIKMDDDRKDDAAVKNGFSSELSSPKSSSSNETAVSNLPSSSAYHPLDDSMTKSAQSKSSHPSSSVLSDLTPDSAKASETISVAADYSGTRFDVKLTDSSELQSPVASSSDSTSRMDRASSQSPKSVKFVVNETEAGPSRGKSPQKSSSLTKSLTSNALTKLLFKQQSQDSVSSKEEIELPAMKSKTSDDYKVPSDDPSEKSSLLDSVDPQPLTTIEVRGVDGTVSAVAVEDIPNTPELPSSEASTASGERLCQQKSIAGFLLYLTTVASMVVAGFIFWWAVVHFGMSSKTNDTLISANETKNSTMPLTLDALNLDQRRQEFDKLLFTVPETTTDAFATDEFTTDAFTTDADTMATDFQNIDNPTTTTNTPFLNVLTTDASTTTETTTHRND